MNRRDAIKAGMGAVEETPCNSAGQPFAPFQIQAGSGDVQVLDMAEFCGEHYLLDGKGGLLPSGADPVYLTFKVH